MRERSREDRARALFYNAKKGEATALARARAPARPVAKRQMKMREERCEKRMNYS